MKVPVPPKRRAPGKTTAKRPAAHTKEKGEVDLSNYSYGEAPADSGGVAGQLDLVFCLDCTGSMSSVISACQASILSLVESLTHAEGQDVRFCLIPYRDHGAGEAFCTRVYPFTRDVAQMQANVNAQEACGGGDTPEAVAAAMYEALCLDWRDGAAKLVVVMADAGPHGLGEGAAFPDGDPDGKDPLVIAREMHGLGVAVYSVVSGGTERTRHFFAAVAAMTGGQSVDLRDAALLGDACHPMTPYMAQGASSAIEDACVLSRCLDGVDADGAAAALNRYERTRLERTATIQRTSAQNTWLKNATNPDWVYGYDAWTTPLAQDI